MEIIWTRKALESYKELAIYLNNSFGRRVTESILAMIDRRVNKLLVNPLFGKKYNESNSFNYEFCFFVVNKQSKVFYFIKGEYIYILLVYDTRQDIRKIHELLSSIK